ncbi:unnamed protein product, partial [Rhizoctonia solani]
MRLLSRKHSLNNGSHIDLSSRSEDSSLLSPRSPCRCGKTNRSFQSRRNPIPEPQISHPQVNTTTAWKSQSFSEAEMLLQEVNIPGRCGRSKSSVISTPPMNPRSENLNTLIRETHANLLAATLY